MAKSNKKQSSKSVKIGRSRNNRIRLILFVSLFAVVGSYFLLKTFATAPLVASIESEQMVLPTGTSIISNSAASSGKAVRMSTNGKVNGRVYLSQKAVNLGIVAKGIQCRGAPTMTIYIDNIPVSSAVSVSSTSWTTYSLKPGVPLAVGAHDISISFNNDRTVNRNSLKCSRDLFLDISKFYGAEAVATPAPTASINASPTNLVAGSSSNLVWASTNASSCTASGAWAGSQALSGSLNTGALNQTSTYTLTCTGSGGSAQASATVTVSAASPVTSPVPLGVTGNWALKFNDEFVGTSLNKSVWTPGWFGTSITGPVNDTETACYDPTLLTMPGDGSLHMKLISKTNSCKGKSRPYTGSLISSNPTDYVSGHTGFQFSYGYKEFRAYLPATASGSIANWPGFWSDGQNWPTDGEDDVMEGLSGSACYHFHAPVEGPGGCASGNYTGWHVFGSNWQPGLVTYYYDGKEVGRINTGITGALQYLIAQNTTSSDSPTVVPAEVLLDYVRVWQ